MTRFGPLRGGALVALAAAMLASAGTAQTRRALPPGRAKPAAKPAKFVPKFEVWAETPLLMEGLAQSNYRGLQRLLKKKPADTDTWVFARGQALLLAETGNLLLLRPPRNSGRDTWMKLAMDMRSKAGALARQAAARDYAGSKTALTDLTNACNRCHKSFRIPVRVGPEAEPKEQPKEEQEPEKREKTSLRSRKAG
jgi:hypothetical protein